MPELVLSGQDVENSDETYFKKHLDCITTGPSANKDVLKPQKIVSWVTERRIYSDYRPGSL